MSDETYLGPYRATKLWNDVIRTFRTGVPVGRHRRYMKTYDDCFIASVAIDWLHEHLVKNVNFGPSVSRSQTIQLLQKFHKARVFEDVRDGKYNCEEFSDGSRLFRIIYCSPSPDKPSRPALTSRTNLNQSNAVTSKPDMKPPPMSSKPPQCQQLVTRELSASEIRDIWKSAVLRRLQSVLGLSQLSDILDESLVNGDHIVHNCSFINKNGVVTNINPKDQLPHWALSAMRCLAHWPDRVDDHLPIYPGFEKDVFRVIKDYFDSLREPLLTYEMYEIFTNVFVEAENRGLRRTRPFPDAAITSFESVENLMLNLTLNNTLNDISPSGDDNDAASTDSSRSYGLNTNIDCLDCVDVRQTAISPSDSDEAEATVPHFADRHDDNKPSATTNVASRRHISPSYLENKRNTERSTASSPHLEDYCTLPRGKASIRHGKPDYGYTVALVKRADDDRITVKHRTSYVNPSYVNDENVNCLPRYLSPRDNGVADPDLTRSNWRKVRHVRSSSQEVEPSPRDHVSDLHEPPPYVPPPSYQLREMKRRSDQKARADDAPFHVTRIYCDNLSTTRSTARSQEMRRRSASHSNLLSDAVFQSDAPEKRLSKSQYQSTPALVDQDRNDRVCEALQLTLLLLPPANRRKLHLLLRLMYKMCHNIYLHLSSSTSLRVVVLESFYRAIVASSDPADMDELRAIQVVTFLVDHYAEVLAVPEKLATEVESCIARLTMAEPPGHRRKLSENQQAFDANSTTFCVQVSRTEYEHNKAALSRAELVQLLDGLIEANYLSTKDKRKKIAEFARSHPDVYKKRFPTPASLDQLVPKKQALLVRPLKKLRNIRL